MNLGEFSVAEGKLGYRAWTSASAGDVLVQIHGIESHSEWFTPVAELLQERQVTTYALDRLGSGRSEGRRGHVGGTRPWVDHLALFIDWVRRRCRPRAVHLVGSCWGGKLAVHYALDRPDSIDSLILLSPALRVRIDVPLRDKLLILLALRRHPERLFPVPIEREELFTREPEALEYIRRDPLRLHRVTARFLYETRKMDRDNVAHIDRLRLPVLALLAAEDRIVDVPAVIEMLHRAQSSELRFRVLPGVSHSLEFGAAERVADEIEVWLGQRAQDLGRCA